MSVISSSISIHTHILTSSLHSVPIEKIMGDTGDHLRPGRLPTASPRVEATAESNVHSLLTYGAVRLDQEEREQTGSGRNNDVKSHNICWLSARCLVRKLC